MAVIQATLVFLACLARWVSSSALGDDSPWHILFMMLIALVFAALGTAIGSVLQDMQGFQLIMNFLVLPIYFLSGALYPLKNLKTANEDRHSA